MAGPVMLVILDGFGIGDGGVADSTAIAHTPFFDRAREQFPTAQVETSGEAVGLPPGQMGNSEVGHMTMGAGRIVEQDMTRVGNALALRDMPTGTTIHNIELSPGHGGKMVRGAGTSAQLLAREDDYAMLRMPSGEVRRVLSACMATIGAVGNAEHKNQVLGKAGRSRHLGRRPSVRGSAMNPRDHPHGGGEGRSPIGMSHPKTPWGKPALGPKTRKRSHTDVFIVRDRRKR